MPDEGEVEELNELLEGDLGGHEHQRSTNAAASSSAAFRSDEEQGPATRSEAAPTPTAHGVGAPSWSLLLPATVWAFLSRLDFYEGDASLTARERLFHRWWLKRRLPVSRAITFVFVLLSVPTAGVYFWIVGSYSVRPSFLSLPFLLFYVR